jgi:hypothetical protein
MHGLQCIVLLLLLLLRCCCWVLIDVLLLPVAPAVVALTHFNSSYAVTFKPLMTFVVYQLQGQDCSGETKPFQKPWLQTALMFVAMAFCLPIGYGIEAWQKHNKRKNKANSSGDRQRRGAGGQAGQRKVIMIATDAAAAAEVSAVRMDSKAYGSIGCFLGI